MVKRRRMRRYRGMKQNSGVKFLGFIGIMISAVICGYLTARFVVAPLLGYDTEVLKLDFPSKMTAFVEKDNQEQKSSSEEVVKDEQTDGSYALQFGVFSSEAGASALVDTLKKKDVVAEVKKIDGQFKVLSETFSSKEEALKALETLKDKQNIDVFITVVNDDAS